MITRDFSVISIDVTGVSLSLYHRRLSLSLSLSLLQGGVVYRQKKRGEEARGFTTVRGTPQNGDGRTCVRQAEPQEILCYAMRVSDLGSLFVFFEGFG